LQGSCGVAIAIPQDRTAPLLAIMAGNIAAAAPGTASADEVFAATLVAIIVTTFVTGVFLLGLGIFRAGGLMRFIPYSVLAGFFAGTGWLLALGGLRVITGMDLDTWSEVRQLAEPELVRQWLSATPSRCP
jgi:SulP family sulfate permease